MESVLKRLREYYSPLDVFFLLYYIFFKKKNVEKKFILSVNFL